SWRTRRSNGRKLCSGVTPRGYRSGRSVVAPGHRSLDGLVEQVEGAQQRSRVRRPRPQTREALRAGAVERRKLVGRERLSVGCALLDERKRELERVVACGCLGLRPHLRPSSLRACRRRGVARTTAPSQTESGTRARTPPAACSTGADCPPGGARWQAGSQAAILRESGRRESNSRSQLGKLMFCR